MGDRLSMELLIFDPKVQFALLFANQKLQKDWSV